MKKAEIRKQYEDQFEVHCVVCGARIGFFGKGDTGNGIPCSRCKRLFSFRVQDGITTVWCQQQKN